MTNVIVHPLPSRYWELGVDQLLDCLNPWLQDKWQTTLIAAKHEPFYAPSESTSIYHQIQFAHGYFNSVLHEMAHWCIAGFERRQLDDFGYWYNPDGRNAEQQKAFEKVEIKPQAVEWHLAASAGRRFQVSVDNLAGVETDPTEFKQAVLVQAQRYQKFGLPKRAQQACDLLQACYNTELNDEVFSAFIS